MLYLYSEAQRPSRGWGRNAPALGGGTGATRGKAALLSLALIFCAAPAMSLDGLKCKFQSSAGDEKAKLWSEPSTPACQFGFGFKGGDAMECFSLVKDDDYVQLVGTDTNSFLAAQPDGTAVYVSFSPDDTSGTSWTPETLLGTCRRVE